MLSEEQFKRNLGEVQNEVGEFCSQFDRSPNEVVLLPVTKKWPVDAVRFCKDAGIGKVGENRVQEAVKKIDVLQDLSGLEWHLVGHLQKNKARFCPGRFQWIHSLDSLELAKRLSRTCLEQNTSLNVLIQLNLSGEDSKSGLEDWEQLRNLSEELMNLEKLELRGLMTMPAPDQDERETRRVFARLREMQERLKSELNAPQIDQLSMGMTSDYAWAILEGATMIRVGSAIFGVRQ